MAYLWQGSGSCEQETTCGALLLDNLSMCENRMTFKEGEETEEFWAAAGGQQNYHRD